MPRPAGRYASEDWPRSVRILAPCDSRGWLRPERGAVYLVAVGYPAERRCEKCKIGDQYDNSNDCK